MKDVILKTRCNQLNKLDMASKRSQTFSLVPFPCLIIDATWRDAMSSMSYLLESDDNRDQITAELSCIWNNDQSPTCFILPCLSVRSALDLYLQVKKYPPGSELIMSAINIPQMSHIAQYHGLKVVPLDINIDTLAPDVQLLESLINENTVAIVIAHIYGRWSDISDVINVCLKHKLTILEDCAQAFCGFKKLGHPKADLSFFSFGAIKSSTAFGGAIVRVKDQLLFNQMKQLSNKYSIQSRMTYLKKILNCVIGMMALNSRTVMRVMLPILKALGIDHKEAVISMLRGFPVSDFKMLRLQPSTALLRMMLRRFLAFDESAFQDGMRKCDFVSERLPENTEHVGKNAETRNYWLFPIIVNDPEKVLKELNRRGIDAYRGATQLTCLEAHPCPTFLDSAHTSLSYPSEARYLTDHVIYLPVHKTVPYFYLEKICLSLEEVMKEMTSRPVLKKAEVDVIINGQVKLESKL